MNRWLTAIDPPPSARLLEPDCPEFKDRRLSLRAACAHREGGVLVIGGDPSAAEAVAP
jgi:hypothetical protein